MKCQILFSGKNKKNISKCRLLKFLPRVLRVKNVTFCSVWFGSILFAQACLSEYLRTASASLPVFAICHILCSYLLEWQPVPTLSSAPVLNWLLSVKWLSWMRIPLVIRRLQVRHLPGRQHSFMEIWLWNIFYGHSIPSGDSRRAVSFWQKNVHNTG